MKCTAEICPSAIKAERHNDRPDIAQSALWVSQTKQCNDSMLEKWYAFLTTHIQEGTNQLLYLQELHKTHRQKERESGHP